MNIVTYDDLLIGSLSGTSIDLHLFFRQLFIDGWFPHENQPIGR